MKKLLSLVLTLVSLHLFAQTYPITNINITLPANPDPNTTNWGIGSSVFIIMATAQAEKGGVDPMVEESKMLVQIKQNGGKVCGSYTANNAPAADFNAITKVWSGGSAASFLGKGCILPPGDYELSVQFFGSGAAGTVSLSDEKIKLFTIKNTSQQDYQPPHLLSPDDGTVFNDGDVLKPLIFRWTPIIPMPQQPVTYRLQVWQLIQGQTGTQAIAANMPILTKDVSNITQAVVTNLITGLCKPPYLCDFVWSVRALDPDGKAYGANKDIGDVFTFKYAPRDTVPAVVRCSCGAWDVLIVNRTIKYQCGGKNIIPWKCSQSFSFSNTYQCSSKDQSCQAKTNWEIKKDSVTIQTGEGANSIAGTFIPTANGTYTITLYADCNGIKCPPCIYTIAVEGCKGCDCGTWGPLAVNNEVKYAYGTKKIIPWKCNQPLGFTSVYQCGSDNQDCRATTSWEIDRDGVSIDTGSSNRNNIAASFTPPTNGTYTIKLNSLCGGLKCPPATYTFSVTNCKNCDCGGWIDSAVNIKSTSAAPSKLKFGETASLAPGTYKINIPGYACSSGDSSCSVDYLWSVQGGPVAVNGSRQTIVYNFSTAGTYTIMVTPVCGKKSCLPFQVTVNIEQPQKKQPGPSSYYTIRPEYSSEVIAVKDTLFIQVENAYASGSNQFTYTIRNLSNNKTSKPTKLAVTNNQGLIRIALPLQNSVVQTGETGILIMNDFKKYYYISFKRN